MTQQMHPTHTPQPRRRARWERYRVTHPFSTKAQAGLWGSIAGIVALAALLGWALEIKGGVIIVAAIPVIVGVFENQRTAFQFDATGLRVGTVAMPWTDVTQLVVAVPPNGSHAILGARLRPGASLPVGPPPNPAVSAPIQVAVQPHKIDLAKLTAKTRKYAPPHIRIVVIDHHGERVAA